MTQVITLDKVVYSISGRQILREVSLSVEAGETLMLLGRSGSGKTTLLKMLNRLVEPTSGTITFEGKLVSHWDVIQLRRRIGYVIQDGGLMPHLSVERNVGLVPRLENWPEERIRPRVAQLLETVGLPASVYGSRYPRQLSGGEKQRVGIARALAANPPLMLLDEPFAALDPVTRFELQQQFLNLRRDTGLTAIFVTHDVREALMMGSRIALLSNGQLEALTTPQEFLAARTPEAEAFLQTLKQEWRPQ